MAEFGKRVPETREVGCECDTDSGRNDMQSQTYIYRHTTHMHTVT